MVVGVGHGVGVIGVAVGGWWWERRGCWERRRLQVGLGAACRYALDLVRYGLKAIMLLIWLGMDDGMWMCGEIRRRAIF